MPYLTIDTATHGVIRLSLHEGERELGIKTAAVDHAQAEKLLPLVEQLLRKHGLKLQDLEKIAVANKGEGFTSLRIGVATANALAYALAIPVVPASGAAKTEQGIAVAVPEYSRPPSITKKS